MNVHSLAPRTPRWLLPAVLAMLLGGATWVVAESKSDEPAAHRSVDVKVDATPLPREGDSTFSYSPIVKRVIPSVVKVVTRERAKEMEVDGGSPFDDPAFRQFFGPFFGAPNTGRRIIRQPPQIGLGSGVIVSADGYILTNNHVVDGADKVQVTLADKRVLTAKVVGTDKKTDVAVIKVDADNLPALTFADSGGVQVGDRVLAVGNPFGLGETVTSGIVSGLGRVMPSDEASYNYQDYIQTDAAINPGNSGGPLVDTRGDVIGINSAIASETGFYSGYGFAIPINLAHTVMEQLIKTGHVERAVMGIAIRDASPEDADAVGLKDITGVVVNSYTGDDSPAKAAGIQPGDVIVALDGQSVSGVPQLQQMVGFKKPGETVDVTVVRQGGVRKSYTVRLTRAPSGESEVASREPSGGKGETAPKEESLGISVQPLTPDDAQNPRFRSVVQSGGGMVVTDVSPDGPAYQRLSAVDDPGGPDIIVKVNGTPTHTRADFRQALASVKRGDVVTLQVLSPESASGGWTGRVLRLRTR